MFTSDDRDDFDDDSFLGHHQQFLSEQDQREVHQNHQHLSLFYLPTPNHLPCLDVDHFDYFAGRFGPNPDPDLTLFNQQQQGEVVTDSAVAGEGTGEGEAVEVEVEKRVTVASGRSSKKDRHSKITTSRGLRDRRMRLSLEVAREFFDLQDMLGFDKASKTVEWLISQSKSAIEEIIRKVRGSNSIAASYGSDCEIGFEDDNGSRTVEISSGQKQSKKEKKASQSRRRDSHQRSSSATKDSRMKARERARERTLKKRRKKTLVGSRLSNPTNPCSSPHEAGEDSSCIQDQTATTGSNLEILTQYEEIAGMAGRISIDVSSSYIVSGKWSPNAASSSNLNLQEVGIPQSQQLRNREQFFKQWEAYYNYGFDHT